MENYGDNLEQVSVKESSTQASVGRSFKLNLFVDLLFILVVGLTFASQDIGGLAFAIMSIWLGLYILCVSVIYCYRYVAHIFLGRDTVSDLNKPTFILSIVSIILVAGSYVIARFLDI